MTNEASERAGTNAVDMVANTDVSMGTSHVERRRQLCGQALLVLVNLLWVLSAEATKFIFVDEHFNHPFFTVYLKSMLCSVYLIKFIVYPTVHKNSQNLYSRLENTDSIDGDKEINLQMDELIDPLSDEGFEPIAENSLTSEEEDRARRPPSSNSQNSADSEGQRRRKKRRVRFARSREVKRLPQSEAEEAKLARMSYDAETQMLVCDWQPTTLYSLFYLAPLFLTGSFTYQAALLYTSVSSLNLISSSSSIFILLLSICFPSSHARFTLFKALLVAINLSGVLIVSEFASTLAGTILSQISAFCYAVYLISFSRIEQRVGKIDVTFMFGCVGIVALLFGPPLLWFLNATGIESLHPLPNQQQFLSIIGAGLFGTLLADYLWLLAASMTDSLSTSLSLSLSIPFSFLADMTLRNQPPSAIQLFAAVPIVFSFVVAGLLDQSNPVKSSKAGKSMSFKAGKGKTMGRRKTHEDEELLLDDEEITEGV